MAHGPHTHVLRALVVISVITLVAFFVFSSKKTGVSETPSPTPVVQKPELKINDTSVFVEIVDTPESMRLGLGERDSLQENDGMLFVYPQKQSVIFWMKAMRFPLDIIWIADDKVVQIDANVPHEPEISDDELKRYISNQKVNYVLEVNAGFAEKHGISVGAEVLLP